jgi:1-pyrroline-5-carboxylate dehydrogenase
MDKITYASLGALGEDFHQSFDTALSEVRQKCGRTHPLFIAGKSKRASAGTFPDRSPTDTRLVLGHFQRGNRADARKAIAAAHAAYPGWSDRAWSDRIRLLRRAAELMTQRQFELAAQLTLEVGKNRFEAIAEVSEAIDLILYYCQQMEEQRGFETPLAGTGAEHTRSLLRPYGVWAVVSPFNFPLALATGMAAGALVAGNTVVFKPASDTPWSGLGLSEVLRDAELPEGVFNFVTGPGRAVGEELVAHPGVDGFVFTGSQAVGLSVYHRFARNLPKPCIVEMGGKNSALVMPSANLDDAAEGVMRSAFGMGGQKCSACSRLYLHRDIARPFLELLVEKTTRLKIGDPAARDVFLGPLINAAAVKKFERAARLGKQEGRLIRGGRTLRTGEFARGFFVEPTIADRLPKSSRLFQEEFFAPVLAVTEVRSLDEAIGLANTSDYGLTAGIFTQDDAEQQRFFDRIEAGVTYCNRRGGATTGAWPGVQSFGGWKGSGSSGKNALGPYYVQQFMREQSRTVVKRET